MSQKTMKLIAKIVSGLMIVSVLLGLIVPLAYANNDILSQLIDAESQLSSLEKERQSILKRLEEIQLNQETTYEEIAILDQQIANTSAQINTTQGIIDRLSEEIAYEEQNLIEATQRMDEQYDSMKTSIRVMYEAGETTYLDIILASSSLFDMLSRIEISQQIINHNKNIFDEYTENALAVERAKLKLEEDKETQEGFRMTLDAQKLTLEKESAIVEQKMKKLMEDEVAAEKAISANMNAEEEMAKKVAQLSKELASSTQYVGGAFLWPTPSTTRITSAFGYRTHPITGQAYSYHKGIDIGAAGGAAILSANDGRVIVSDYSSSYGNYIMVDHGGGYVTLYAHMSQRLVSAGTMVERGEQIGKVGSTGWSTGNHLHFEIIYEGTHQNPMDYFS